MTGIYDCNSAGSADPTGAEPRHCNFGDAGPPAGMLPKTCGALTAEGCCDGSVLRFCDYGRPRAIDCGRNPYCGFRGVGQIYNCGTSGEADPRGKYPQSCPALPKSAIVEPSASATAAPAPAAAPAAPDAGSPPRGKTTDKASCAVGGAGHQTLLLLFLGALLVAIRRAIKPS